MLKILYSKTGKLWLVTLCLIATLTACKKSDWFDVKSDKKLLVPETLDNLQAILDNSIIINLNYPAMGESASDDHFVPDASIANLTPKDLNAYTWSHDLPYVNVNDWAKAGFYDGPYEFIYLSNLVLDGVKKLPAGSAQYNDVKGQALFMRAFNFFCLSQLFAPIYNASSANTDLGIPLRLEADINIKTTRSTVAQTYSQIIADLKEAESLLPQMPAYKTRGSKAAAENMLARVYLSMGDYVQAGNYANLSLQNYATLLDYNTLALTASPIFPRFGDEVSFSVALTSSGAVNGGLMDQDLYNSYDANDLRKVCFFKQAANGTVVINGTYYYSVPFGGTATDEMYLTRAESYARAGNTQSAMADLNTLLRMRYKQGTFTNLTAPSADAALVIILAERRKELVNRGLRWIDMRRLSKEDRFKKTYTRTVKGKTYTLEPGSFRYTFPIPDDIIQITGIQQNPGW